MEKVPILIRTSMLIKPEQRIIPHLSTPGFLYSVSFPQCLFFTLLILPLLYPSVLFSFLISHSLPLSLSFSSLSILPPFILPLSLTFPTLLNLLPKSQVPNPFLPFSLPPSTQLNNTPLKHKKNEVESSLPTLPEQCQPASRIYCPVLTVQLALRNKVRCGFR